MLVSVFKTRLEMKEEAYKKAKRDNVLMQKEIQKINEKRRSKNAGFSEEGYNLGLGEYVRDKAHYHSLVKQKKAENPNFEQC